MLPVDLLVMCEDSFDRAGHGLFLLNHVLEVRTWLEGRNLVLRDDHCSVLGDVSTGLCLSGLHLECAEAAKVYVVLLCK